jgi:hypothetical protein
LTAKILDNNPTFYINITGIMVGNGIMSFVNHSLDKSQIQYMRDHNFLSPAMMEMFR